MQFVRNSYSSLTQKFGRNRTIIGLVLLFVILIYLGYSFMGTSDVALEETPVPQTVRTVSLYTISATDDGTAVRTADGNAFIVRAESGGRVERVAQVGDVVARGAIVAQIENSAQRAAVLQAQGAYEAALAAANQSSVGQGSAERAYAEAITQAKNTYRSAFSTADNTLRNTVDQVFSQPDSVTPGLKIDTQGSANALNRDRVMLESLFDTWQGSLNTIADEDILSLLQTAETNTTKLSAMVVTLTSLLNDDNSTLSTSLRTDFAQARSTLTGVLASLSSARSALIAAQTARDQAAIAGTNATYSLADAQVKQALGVLESARAALSKTAVKTPVSGTITAASISVGDIITIGSDVVFVAGETGATSNTADIVTVPLTSVKFTPSKAYVFTVEDGKVVAHEVTTGSVTTNSIAISGTEGIEAIVLDVRGLKEGETVVTE